VLEAKRPPRFMGRLPSQRYPASYTRLNAQGDAPNLGGLLVSARGNGTLRLWGVDRLHCLCKSGFRRWSQLEFVELMPGTGERCRKHRWLTVQGAILCDLKAPITQNATRAKYHHSRAKLGDSVTTRRIVLVTVLKHPRCDRILIARLVHTPDLNSHKNGLKQEAIDILLTKAI